MQVSLDNYPCINSILDFLFIYLIITANGEPILDQGYNTHVRMHAGTHACTYAHMHTQTPNTPHTNTPHPNTPPPTTSHAHTHTYTCIHMHAHTHALTHALTHMHSHMHMYTTTFKSILKPKT